MQQRPNNVARLYSLDVLRGIAALSVVFWHWQHFFYSGTVPGSFDVMRLPLSEWLFPIYTKGWQAVNLFFTLSGFVFYWLYSRKVANGAISAGEFFLLRFSRLYPLHFATLLLAAAGQWWFMAARGSSFIYEPNDSKHFLLNLFFASSWGFERGISSYNGPAWSVSVEVLLYAFFFICCRLFPIRAIVLALIAVAGFVVVRWFYDPVGRGIGSFFLGGCVFLTYRKITSSRHCPAITRVVVYLTLCAWAMALVFPFLGLDLGSLSSHPHPILWRLEKQAHTLWPAVVLFPLTILSLALAETLWGSLGKRFAFLGDISYSVYLLHFPLQFLFLVLVARLALDQSIYFSPWLMGSFFAVLILISLGSYRYFEMPAQRFLRKLGLSPSSKRPA